MQTLLKPIHTAPKDRYILGFAPSGYSTTPLRCEVCIWVHEKGRYQGWVNHAGDLFTESGSEPVYWCDIPDIDSTIPLGQAEWKRMYGQELTVKLRDYSDKLYQDYAANILGKECSDMEERDE